MTRTQSPVLIETSATGGRTMPLSMTCVQPDRAVSPAELSEQTRLGGDLNVPFVAGTLSAFLAHERAGAALYRVAAGHSENPMLTTKYHEFAGETVEHIGIYEQLITDLGGDPHYVSPAARITEQLGAKLLEGPVLLAGSVDLVTLETAFLEAVLVAEHKCRDNWILLARLGEMLPDQTARSTVAAAVARVRPQEDEHAHWAADTWLELAVTNATSPAASAGMGVLERAAHKVKDALT